MSNIVTTSPKEPEFTSATALLSIEASKFPAVIETEEVAEQVTGFLGKIRKLRKEMEKDRKSITDPLRSVIDNIMGRYKSMDAPLKVIDDTLTASSLAWASEKRRRAEEDARIEAERRRKLAEEEERKAAEAREAAALQAAADAFARGDLEDTAVAEEQAKTIIEEANAFVAPTPNVKVDAAVRSSTGATSGVSMIWKFKTVCLKDVPAEYLIVNEVAVNKAIRSGVREIPGLEIFEEAAFRLRNNS